MLSNLPYARYLEAKIIILLICTFVDRRTDTVNKLKLFKIFYLATTVFQYSRSENEQLKRSGRLPRFHHTLHAKHLISYLSQIKCHLFSAHIKLVQRRMNSFTAKIKTASSFFCFCCCYYYIARP